MIRNSQRTSMGYNLIELMVVISIIGIMSLVAIPSYITVIKSDRLVVNANRLTAVFKFARSEAIKREANVSLSATSDGKWQVVFNGEVLNYFEKSHSDVTISALPNLTINSFGETGAASISVTDGDEDTQDWCFSVLISGQSSLDEGACGNG